MLGDVLPRVGDVLPRGVQTRAQGRVWVCGYAHREKAPGRGGANLLVMVT